MSSMLFFDLAHALSSFSSATDACTITVLILVLRDFLVTCGSDLGTLVDEEVLLQDAGLEEVFMLDGAC